MEASMRGLELHVQGVNSGYADAPLPLPLPPKPAANSAQPLWTPLKTAERSAGIKAAIQRQFWQSVFFGEAPGGCRLVWVSSHTAERWGWGVGGERERRGCGLPSRFHLHFRVGGQCDESRHHSLSDQRLIHPLHQQLIRLDKSQSRCHRGGRGIGTRASNTANT